MSALFIAAIHNGELPSSPAAKTLHQLDRLAPRPTVVEIVEQPPITEAPNLAELIQWGRRQWSLEKQWREYLGRHSPLREAIARVGFTLWRLRLRASSTFRSRSWRIRQVEAVVSAKHQQAWRDFLRSDEWVALVIESDATWIQSSDARIRAGVEKLPSAISSYLNLAGGLPHRSLAIPSGVRGSTDSVPDGFQSFEPAVTNTSCAYLINRSMAELLVSYCHQHPADLGLGIDWLINAAFMWAYASDRPITCWHSEPPALTHGSIAGLTPSWHPAR